MMNFKIIISVFGTLALLSCTKTEIAEQEKNNTSEAGQYEIVATVCGASSMGTDTKAIQTAWVNGDKIFVFSEDCGTGYITLVYNATTNKWAPTTTGTIDRFFTDTEKKVCAIFVPFATTSAPTPTFASGKWTINTGDVFYTYDSDVTVTRLRPHYLNIQITLNAPADYVQIYIDRSRISHVFERTAGEEVTLESNQIDRYDKVTLSGTTFTAVKNTSDTKIKAHSLTVGSESGVAFYGKRNTITGKANFTIQAGAVTYTYTASSAISSKAYNLTETGWTQLLTGKFVITVSGTTYTIQFAPGNLQANYNGGTPKWRFAEEQYDIIGAQDISKYKTKTDGKYPWYDLFGWGATGKAASGATAVPFWTIGSTTPSGAATEQAKFRQDKNSNGANLSLDDDWGANIVDNAAAKTYQTMTYAQWKALLTKYPPVASYITIDGKKHYGMVIQPSGTPKASYTLDAWRTAEMNGAVFFPSAGYRNGNESAKYNTTATGEGFFYWSRTLSNDTGAEQSTYKLPYGFGKYSTDASSNMMVNWRTTGRPVRLVVLQ